MEAGDEMVRRDEAKLRNVRARQLVCTWTAIGEGAHGRKLSQRRAPTGNLAEPAAGVLALVRTRDRVQQPDRVRMLRLGVEVGDRRLLRLAARVHDEHTVGD